MTLTTRLVEAAGHGDRQAAAELLPLVYAELRRIANSKLNQEAMNHSLSATALVHEAYLRLIGDQKFDGREHFFAAASEAMRRILVEAARRRLALKRGGGLVDRAAMDLMAIAAPAPDEQVLHVHETVDGLAAIDPDAASLVKLRFFGGFTMEEIAAMMNISVRATHDVWSFARAWLSKRFKDPDHLDSSECL